MKSPRVVSLTLLACLAACSGAHLLPGSAGAVLAPAGRIDSRGRIPVAFHVVIGRAHRHRVGRSPKFVSPGTDGLAVSVYKHGLPHTGTNLVTSSAVNVSPGAAACGGAIGFPRTCTANVAVAPTKTGTTYDVVIYSYDSPPAPTGSFTGAHLLGVGTLSGASVTVGKANDLTVYLGGVISMLSGLPASVSLPGDGNPHQLALVIDPADFGNHAITAGAKDPFANPITVSLKETNGSGNMLLSLNGGDPAARVTMSHSSDSVRVLYNGIGAAYYGATVTFTAAAVGGFGGATESVNVSPLVLIVSGTASHFPIPPYFVLDGNGDLATVYETELNAPAGMTYTATPSHCSSIVDTTAVRSLIFGVKGFVAFARSTASQGACSIAVSDGMSAVTMLVINQYTGALGAPNIAEFGGTVPLESSTGIAAGPDGAMWFMENVASAGGRIARIDATGTNPAESDYTLPTTHGNVAPSGLAVGPDDNFWYTGYGSQIGYMSTSGVGAVWSLAANTEPTNIVQGSDGAMWFTEAGSGGEQIGRIATDGTTTFSGVIGTSPAPNGIALGSDGNIWFTESGAGTIGKITSDMIATQFVLAAGSTPEGITAGPDGALWFTDQGKNAIERIPVTATLANPQVSTYTGLTGTYPTGITTGPDGALWFTEEYDPTSGAHQGKSVVGRIDADTHTIAEYSSPSAGVRPDQIAAGPDGAIWFTKGTGGVDRIAIGTSAAAKGRNALPAQLERRSLH
jgi:virginiamycin B lyase